MAERIENTPAPNVLMNSMRSIGYSFKTALSDIVDNSISANAKNIFINSPINENDLFISILDDGMGMSDQELFNAMKYGSEKEKYNREDLGRFGLGLKSASLSQCRILTVASKREGIISSYQWNIDDVIISKKWDCLKLNNDEINSIPNIKMLEKLCSGTIVVWQNFDIACKKSGGHIQEFLMEEVNEATKHLQLVFHRFLRNKFKPIKIFVNNDPIVGLDPFLENHPKTDQKKMKEIAFENEIIKIQPFILPHQIDLSNENIEKLGGLDSLRNNQGFYIYRNDRLIIYGTWFRLSSSSINMELYKYGRIKVDIPNTLDEMWDIDIKKQNAIIPKAILNSLKKAVTNVCEKSKEKTNKRARLTLDKDNSKIWNKSKGRSGKDYFFVNNESSFIKNFLDDFRESDRLKIFNLLEIISSSIPYDDIYASICNRNNETQIGDDTMDAIVMEGIVQFKRIKKLTKKTKKECFDNLCSSEPFNNETISNKIWERINNE